MLFEEVLNAVRPGGSFQDSGVSQMNSISARGSGFCFGNVWVYGLEFQLLRVSGVGLGIQSFMC